jgi:hypothetical protein
MWLILLKKQTVPGNEQAGIPIIPLNDWGKRQNIQTKKVNKGLTQFKVNTYIKCC